jgi:ElaB/YqjD/DUF883 family membrane-anchored ribosome-binding protein
MEKLDREPSMVDITRREPSLSRLEREAEQTRAQLGRTVDALRARVSPAALKQDAKDYVRRTGEDFFHRVERRARENPLQTVAIAAGLAYPVWRIVSSIPAPILLIGAGLALARPRARNGNGQGASEPGLLDQVRETVAHATDAVKDKARQTSDAVKDKVRQTSDAMQQTASSTAGQLSATAEGLQSAVAPGFESARSEVAEAAGVARDALRSAAGDTTAALSSARDQATHVTRRAHDSLIDAIERNPIVVGGIGLFIGAVIAAAIPGSRTENRLMGDTSDELKNRARDLASQGYETAKSAAGNVYEAGRQAAEEQGLSPQGVRDALHDIGQKAGTVYERATQPAGTGEQSQQQGEQSARLTQGTSKYPR